MVTDHGAGRPGVSAPGLVVARDCEACGRPIAYRGRGRRRRYCDTRCRQRAWALRTAERTLAAGTDPRPAVEVVEQERVVQVSTVVTPSGAREWASLLATLAAQLVDRARPWRASTGSTSACTTP